ncbi:hypothetical protein DAEQUDRAFT_704734 [Daedalea quercina L-15889]|uniref:SMP-LTD domain-containing protein n=1 Tax=Daedalea quercina L-15889 TaxID=1314783 RepID=A0A165T546_9APHY|nr:hypothetical protein DAEQUDRAFT_704734 [Daedalea quercina L-15889]
MSLKALLYAYVLGGITFIPLLVLGAIFYTIYTAVPVEEVEAKKAPQSAEVSEPLDLPSTTAAPSPSEINDAPRVRKGWLTVRRTFEEQPSDSSYVNMVRGFLDARSKDARRSRPKDMWYVVLKGKVLYLYEDESMTECEAAIELSGHEVVVYPEGLLDGELFSRRNAICLKPKVPPPSKEMPSVTKEMKLGGEDVDEKLDEASGSSRSKQRQREQILETERRREDARTQALDLATPWFIFVKNVVDMEDWYHTFIHASDNPANAGTLSPLEQVFRPEDMSHLVSTLDEQPDVIPMRWLNALLGRIFFSYYRTQALESYIIGRLMKKISKVKRPGFLSDINVREVSVGNKAPTLSKPMLKELTKEGDASFEIHVHYKGEVRITVEATATINLGARFKTYTVKLVLALVVREVEGNLLVKVKRPPSSRIWYAFTQMPRMVMAVEPVVSDRQITWGMILSTIESRVREVIQDSVVLPNMDDISFFESVKYLRRGGIWADASRMRGDAPYGQGEDDGDDTSSTVSASGAELSKPMPTDPEHPPVQRSYSAEQAKTEAKIVSDAQEIFVNLRREATAVSLPSSPAANISSDSRRRTWFGTLNEDDADALKLGSGGEADRRGRTPDSEHTLTRRSSSTPIASSDDTTTQPTETQQLREDYLAPSVARRSSSQHSQSSSRGTSSSATDDESAGGAGDSSSSSRRSKSPGIGNSSGRSNTTSSTAAFLQTLKSRAGDKQALSNTAKEAMRKWGVNWSGLRKDSVNSGTSEDVADGASAPQDETRLRANSAAHRSRPSYAEVRAAVEQRKHHDGTLGADLRSDPISIPQSGKGKERARSVSPSQVGGGGNSSGGGSPYLAPPLPTSPRPEARSPSPTFPLERTASGRSVQGLVVDEPEERPPAPIHTQPPQAKSMTIPGIHASHRGEVMSMGYAPPPRASPPEKKPAIQSVYRLWKNPGAAGGQTPRGTESPAVAQMQTDFPGHDHESASAGVAAAPVVPSTSDAQAQPEVVSPRPIPPPLPPRIISGTLRKASGGGAATAEQNASAASAALQSIVSKDRSKRASLEPAPPPGSGEANTAVSNGAAAGSPAANAGPDSGGGEGGSLRAPKPVPPALPPRRTPAATPAPA